HNVPRSTQPRTNEQREQELNKIQQYRDLEKSIRQRTTNSQYDQTTFNLSSKLLRINPEYYTIWNVRRFCLSSAILSRSNQKDESEPWSSLKTPHHQVEHQQRDDTNDARGDIPINAAGDCHDSQNDDEEAIRSELLFTIPLLIEFPKCYWLWKYRSWILLQAIERLSAAVARTLWEEELGLVGKMLQRDRRNFHAWDYRRHVVAQLEGSSLGGTSMTEAEFAFTANMIKWDLSNFSAWHNRSQLIPRLMDERNADVAARKAFLQEELATLHEALNVGPEDQSLWYYHQYLVHAILGANGQGLIVRDLSSQDKRTYLENEVNFIGDLLQDYLDVKWIYEALIECTLAAMALRSDGQQTSRMLLVTGWLKKLQELDTKRRGRWHELEKQIQAEL
ncbi:hypothetical protein E4U41_006420, partial [Claviceps citrina]